MKRGEKEGEIEGERASEGAMREGVDRIRVRVRDYSAQGGVGVGGVGVGGVGVGVVGVGGVGVGGVGGECQSRTLSKGTKIRMGLRSRLRADSRDSRKSSKPRPVIVSCDVM